MKLFAFRGALRYRPRFQYDDTISNSFSAQPCSIHKGLGGPHGSPIRRYTPGDVSGQVLLDANLTIRQP